MRWPVVFMMLLVAAARASSAVQIGNVACPAAQVPVSAANFSSALISTPNATYLLTQPGSYELNSTVTIGSGTVCITGQDRSSYLLTLAAAAAGQLHVVVQAGASLGLASLSVVGSVGSGGVQVDNSNAGFAARAVTFKANGLFPLNLGASSTTHVLEDTAFLQNEASGILLLTGGTTCAIRGGFLCQGNTATGVGAAACLHARDPGATAVFEGPEPVVIRDNGAANGVGGLSVDKGGPIILNAPLQCISNRAQSGGCIAADNGQVTINATVVARNNTASSRGGAFYLQFVGSLTINSQLNCIDNNADEGGCFNVGYSGRLELNAPASLRGNRATTRGGGGLVGPAGNGGRSLLSTAPFECSNNVAASNGGCLAVGSTHVVELSGGAVISGNTAGGNGAGVAVIRGIFGNPPQITISGSFACAGNRAAASGGCLYADNSATVTVAGPSCCFLSNTASVSGGAAAVNALGGGTVEFGLSTCNFGFNTADTDGSVLWSGDDLSFSCIGGSRWPAAPGGRRIEGPVCSPTCPAGSSSCTCTSQFGRDWEFSSGQCGCVQMAQCTSSPVAPAGALPFANCAIPAKTYSVCNTSCLPGQFMVPGGSTINVACERGRWVTLGTSTCVGGCAGQPPAVPNASWPAGGCSNGSSASAPPGGACTAACAPGFSGPGYSATCLGNGTWSNATGSCSAQPCYGLPAPLPDATWPPSCNDTASGANCTAVCQLGLTGAPVSACSAAIWGPVGGTPCVNCSVALTPAASAAAACFAGTSTSSSVLTARFSWLALQALQTQLQAVLLGAACSFVPPGSSSLSGPQNTTAVTVSCVRADGSPWSTAKPEQLRLQLTANYTARTPCTAGSASSVMQVPQLQLVALPAASSVCAGNTTLTARFSYSLVAGDSLTGVQLRGSAAASAGGSCSVQFPGGAFKSTGIITVSCTGAFAAPSTVNITLQAEATTQQGACAIATAAATAPVPYLCCKQFDAFAGTAPLASSACAVLCQATAGAVRGFVNQGPGQGWLFAGGSAASSCPERPQAPGTIGNGNLVGSITATCAASNAMAFNITNLAGTDADIRLWVGCAMPSASISCSKAGRLIRFTSATAAGALQARKSDDGAHSSWLWSFTPSATCSCNTLQWAVRQKGVVTGWPSC